MQHQANVTVISTYLGSNPASSGKHLVGSANMSGCLAVTCWYKRGGFELTMKVCRQMMHRLATASFAALALAARRSVMKYYRITKQNG